MSFGITELLVILAIVVLLFGTTKLKSLGSDLGSAIKGFKNAIGSEEEQDKQLEEDVKEATPTNAAKKSSEESQKVGAGKE
ncbi:MAG: twin-arginine translocase TatA/TatE family subunit [Gammaproteobacteria bacterium]|nr:twin-arginine translocase TatA/TatE family subunit [Gammaproteobacteria bacterium]